MWPESDILSSIALILTFSLFLYMSTPSQNFQLLNYLKIFFFFLPSKYLAQYLVGGGAQDILADLS